MTNRLICRFALLLFVLLALPIFVWSQNTLTLQRNLVWPEKPFLRTSPSNGVTTEIWNVENCTHSDDFRTLPVFTEKIALDEKSTLEVLVSDVQWEAFDKKNAEEDKLLKDDLIATVSVFQEKNKFWGFLTVIPVRKIGTKYERATSFTLNIRSTPVTPNPAAIDRGGPTSTSVLSDGDIYKFGIQLNGVYKLDYNFLKNELKIADLDNLDPRNLKLYGNGGKMLPEKTNADRPDDLLENAIQIVGEDDGKFDNGDFILFYAVGVASWSHRPSVSDPEITVQKHLYDTETYYFLKSSAGAGKRLAEQPSVDAGGYETNEFDEVRHFEEDKVNLLDFFNSTQGSGKRFFGDYFYQARAMDYSSQFIFKDLVTGSPARFRAEFAGRSGASSTIKFNVEGTNLSKNINSVTVTDNEGKFAENALVNGSFQPNSDNLKVLLDYPFSNATSEGWLDYIEVNVRKKINLSGDQLEFRDLKSLGYDAATFKVSNTSSEVEVWDVTEASTAKKQKTTLSGTEQSFSVNTLAGLKNFVAFKKNGNLPKPEKALGKIENQNIHGIEKLQMAIIYHADFLEAAEKLANHRRNYSKLEVALIDIEQLYNEFSSGAKDPTAIRDFARMILERDPTFDYLLLFGDGSFDPRKNLVLENNNDFIPVFETEFSFSPIVSHPSDDYFALLSDEEGGNLIGMLDVAVGRFPVNTLTEANAVVDKIMQYDNTAPTLGDWHLRLLYLADDEDSNAHINQADKLATNAEATEKFFNPDKIYIDAYQQIATSGGQRYPDAKTAINSSIFKGALLTQYIGHGGPRGWMQERVTDLSDIANWGNKSRNTFIITATCTFGGYDDPGAVSGGELSLIQTETGAVGLFTTVRPVYIDGNNNLTNAIQKVIFQRINGKYRTVGDILKDGKNLLTSSVENARRFTLLGDPAMYLALPEYRVATTKINGIPVGIGVTDTLRALQLAKIEGIVQDTFGTHLTNFNGRVFMTVFDKKQTLATLGQDPTSVVRTFSVQRNILFKGSAQVKDGVFKIEFNVPKDINYAYGLGKISYYAEDGSPLDAGGADLSSIVVGGNANEINDDTPPLVRVFLNTDAFVSGGITDANPKILVKCEDDYGMNVTGNSLGHDLVAVIDDNVQESIVLNDFYASDQDNYRKGKALFPLRNLAPGKHKISVKGWDIANNSGQGVTEFIVAENGKVALDHVLNYPNPFTTNTMFQFEHNLAGSTLDVQISIFTVAGKLVKTILHNTLAEGYRVNDIPWDGKDEYGDQLAKGVYLYRVKVRGTDVNGNTAQAESNFEKVVILK
jgi:Peptidase family C25/FlgD Ig-like domain